MEKPASGPRLASHDSAPATGVPAGASAAGSLSPREREVLAALAEHATNAEIAERLFLSVRTVESHVASLLRKTGARDRRALAQLATAAAGDASVAPAIRTVTSFVGRAHEREALAAALLEHRLVTAVGPGGVGKTRLAFAVTADVTDRYPDGRWIIDLVPVTDAGAVAATLAEAIGVQEQQGRSPVDALEAWLNGRAVLLVLDNCEHLLDAVGALLEQLLATCPRLTVLATSRARLTVPFEWVFPVPGLSSGPSGDATALFTERARAAGAPVPEEDRGRVDRVCAALDGGALAIELAAARLPALGLDGLEAALADRLALLTGGGRADPRHRSLRATIDWSHDLLPSAERALLRRVSVFATAFSPSAAADVATALPGLNRGQVPSGLAALVDGSLLDAVRFPGGTRYRALETVRQYGAEQAAAAQEADALRSAHLAWCEARAEALEALPQDDEHSMLEVDALADEARSALDRGPIAPQDRERASRVAERLARLVFSRGLLAESQRRFEQAAALASDPATEAHALAAAAGAAEARQFGTPSLRLRRRAADRFAAAALPALAARELARSAEVANRFPGILDPPLEPAAAVPPLLAEARALAGDDRGAAGRIALAEAFATSDADPGKESRALRLVAELEALGDRVGASTALDDLTGVRLVRGDLQGAASAAVARMEVLAPLGAGPELGIELTDALQMATECSLGVGELAAAHRWSRRLMALPYQSRELHLATARAILVSWFQGDFTACEQLGRLFLDGYDRAGRPRVFNLGPSAGAAACAAAMRGDAGAVETWRGTVASLTAMPWERFELLGFRILPLLHRGAAAEALAGGADPSHLESTWYADFGGDDAWATALWRPWYAGLHAEAAVLAGAPDAAERIPVARALARPSPVAGALVDRAQALLDGDASGLGPLADALERLGARYQTARTRIMAGGALRERGEAEMAACGAMPMTWPLGRE